MDRIRQGIQDASANLILAFQNSAESRSHNFSKTYLSIRKKFAPRPMNRWTIEVGETAFETEVLERSYQVPVMVDFWAPWCAPCRVLGPMLEGIAEEQSGEFILAKVNVDENPTLAALFHIQGIPAVKIFKDGNLAAEFTGALPEAAVRELLTRLLPSQEDRQAEEAGTLEEEGQLEAAKAIYEKILAQDLTHPKPLLGMGRILMEAEDPKGSLEHLERVPLTADERREAEQLIPRLPFEEGAEQDESPLRAP